MPTSLACLRLPLFLALGLSLPLAGCGSSNDDAGGGADGSPGDGGGDGDGDGDGTPGACSLGENQGKDKVLPAQSPPCDLMPSQIPQFVSIGFDDNGSAEGLAWIRGVLKDRGVNVTFFNTTSYGANAAVVEAWKNLLADGNEIGNHTVTHLPNHGGRDWGADQWATEINDADAFLREKVTTKLYGFRTPYLEYSDGTLEVVAKSDYVYDASIEEGYEDGQDGTNFFFPYTLDEKSPGHTVQVEWGDGLKEISARPGLWELPVYAVFTPPELRAEMQKRQTWFDPNGGQITGFDYNLWATKEYGGFEMTKDELVATLKYSLDQRLAGNRAPFLFGAHTDYYVADFDATAVNAKVADRRAAIEEFLDYALSKPEVKIVTYKAVLDWMRNPKAN